MNSYQLQQIQQAAIIASQHKNALALHHHQHHQFTNHHHHQQTQVQNLHQPSHTSSSSSTSSNSHSRPIVERGASWSYNETRILLSLWGEDMVQRQLNQTKRTRHVWVKIAEAIQRHGFDRTAEQVRTRVFNMIAEYRRILKNPSPERKKKCIFFDAVHKIYQAKDTNGVKAALNNYEEDYNLDPIDFRMSDENHDHNVTDAEDGSGNETEEKETFAYDMSPSTTLANGHSGTCNLDAGNDGDSLGENDATAAAAAGATGAGSHRGEHSVHGPPGKRARTDSSLSNSMLNISSQSAYMPMSHQSSQSYLNVLPSIDATASVLLVDRMFAHLAKETEVMREWVQLERDRLKDEMTRRKDQMEREERRENAFLAALGKMQEQLFAYLSNSLSASGPSARGNKYDSSSSGATSSSSVGNDCTFNCHSTTTSKNSNHHATSTSCDANDSSGKNNVNRQDLLSNCKDNFTGVKEHAASPEIDEENFSSASLSGVSNNVSEGEDEDTPVRSTDDLSKPHLCA